MNQSLSEIVSKYGLRKSGSRWVGPCPECGGSKTSDRFQLFDDGGYRCYSCDFRGDRIKWLRVVEKMSCPEAHLEAGIDCRTSATCPAKDTCRLGSGEKLKSVTFRKGRTVTPPPPASTKSLPVIDPKHPNDKWVSWATELLGGAMFNLSENTEQLGWLSRRGIDAETARRFCLGWLDHDRRVDRQSIGLPPHRDGKDKMWVPGGLVIPIMNGSGIHRLRIRRTDEAMSNFLPNRKYVWIEGSGNLPMIIPPVGKLRGSVVVEAELDAMATAAAHDDVAVIAIGSVSGGLHPALKKRLGECPVILVALDCEPGKDGKPGPGPEWAAIWQNEFRHAKYWPVPVGKDPGDFAKAGGDIAIWVEAGLPRSSSHDLPLSPGCSPTKGKGCDTQSFLGEKNQGQGSGRPRPPVSREVGDVPPVASEEPAIVAEASGSDGQSTSAYASDIDELKALLAEANGFFSVYGQGRGVGPRINPEWAAENRGKRRRISELLNSSEEVGELICRLGDGVYNHMTLPV